MPISDMRSSRRFIGGCCSPGESAREGSNGEYCVGVGCCSRCPWRDLSSVMPDMGERLILSVGVQSERREFKAKSCACESTNTGAAVTPKGPQQVRGLSQSYYVLLAFTKWVEELLPGLLLLQQVGENLRQHWQQWQPFPHDVPVQHKVARVLRLWDGGSRAISEWHPGYHRHAG